MSRSIKVNQWKRWVDFLVWSRSCMYGKEHSTCSSSSKDFIIMSCYLIENNWIMWKLQIGQPILTRSSREEIWITWWPGHSPLLLIDQWIDMMLQVPHSPGNPGSGRAAGMECFDYRPKLLSGPPPGLYKYPGTSCNQNHQNPRLVGFVEYGVSIDDNLLVIYKHLPTKPKDREREL